MAANFTIDHEQILAARQSLIPARGSGWQAGFKNMLGKELGEWFGTRRWIVQTLIWLLIFNGMLTLILFVIPNVDPTSDEAKAGSAAMYTEGISLFFGLAVQIGVIGMIILSQDEVIQEKQSGTAAWILSKPVSRQAFLLSKMVSTLAGGLLFILLLPGLVAYVQILIATGQAAPVLPYLLALGATLLTLAFYLALVILLGVVFDQRGPVLGIAFVMLFAGMALAGVVPQLGYILPMSMQNIAEAIVQRQPLPPVAISQLIATAVWTVVFTIAALARFQREEL